MATRVTHRNITWVFDKDYTVGQFANGDWWVIGPVVIVRISPPSLISDTRIINGSMINPDPTIVRQGFDSGTFVAYSNDLNKAIDIEEMGPLVLEVGSSFISTISKEVPDDVAITDAEILTVLSEAPENNSFRPPYCGKDKKIYGTINDINWSLLKSLQIIGEPNEVYISFWIYIGTGFSFQYGDSYGYIAILYEDAHGANPIILRLYSTTAGAPDRWRVSGVDLTQTDSATNFSLGEWHHIEIYYLAGSSEDGIARVWVDDDLIFEDTAVTSDHSPDYVRIGYSGGAVASGSTLYYDYISGEDEMPAGGGGGIPSLSEGQLVNSKLLNGMVIGGYRP